MEKLNELVEALYPKYGAPGSRDVDVTARRKAIDESAAAIAEAFRALEQEVQKNLEGALAWQQRAETAEDAGRNVAKQLGEVAARAQKAEQNLVALVPEEWYFQLTLDIPNLEGMTPYQAHRATWEQSRTAILRKIEEAK